MSYSSYSEGGSLTLTGRKKRPRRLSRFGEELKAICGYDSDVNDTGDNFGEREKRVSDGMKARADTSSREMSQAVSEEMHADNSGAKLSLPGHISLSQILSWRRCPRQYQYSHMKQIPGASPSLCHRPCSCALLPHIYCIFCFNMTDVI